MKSPSCNNSPRITSYNVCYTKLLRGQDYGQEWDLQASYPLTPYLSGLVKYAHYDSDGFATDTDKAWLMLTASF